ncbi:1-phosphatidylinositol phosphodiesterase [Chitinophaga terrae (ex Kim and Jung 2007)]|uniref:phosphatidylinositol-specific phospholipase C n=1 Tax=Chitinophaga terrae (ex Kim and Jung 2007) TaxID=408074 RepID=UPI00278AA204|nr:phosphatidylinositol-specific phospholipase C [Chitinophaga terrae (ex Kim and Jung 2007)]MDQ0110161.1 1-phosphatidylinositol phosphodiesterase [Chitinophaga terrae (ex Kim and Jung 2007)]
MKRHTYLLALLTLGLFSCKKDLTNPETRLSENSNNSQITASALTVSLTAWMGAINDNTSLSALSIPGTHDSGARVEPVSGTAKCQNLSIREQLDAGTRYLDIRCRHIGDAFAIHHGSIYQNLNFNDVITACYDFLATNPTETIIMSVKEEYDPSNNTRSFEQTFDSYTQANPSKWVLGATIPTLGSVRGKIVLLRRFGASNTPKGIDATNWADNTTFSINNGNANLRVQDQYVVPDNNGKWTSITNLLSEAYSGSSSVLYLNYTSGYKSLIFGIPSITTVSNAINPKIDTYFTTNTHGRYGVIPMDFATASRNTLIINTNF